MLVGFVDVYVRMFSEILEVSSCMQQGETQARKKERRRKAELKGRKRFCVNTLLYYSLSSSYPLLLGSFHFVLIFKAFDDVTML